MKLTLQQLEAHLWGAANILRGKTAGQDYKNYILSLMFYKRLCDQWECEAAIGKINSVLHGLEADIKAGASTITDPQFLDDGRVQRFSLVLANFPFSDEFWWLKPEQQTDDKKKKDKLKQEIFGKEGFKDPFGRFGRGTGFQAPPAGYGDYAFILHILASLGGSGRAGPGGVEVVQPRTRNGEELSAFLAAHAGWILEQLDRAQRLRGVRRTEQRPVGEILYRGEPTRVRIEPTPSRAAGNTVCLIGGEVVVSRGPSSRTPVARSLELWLRREARGGIERHLAAVTARLGQRPQSVYVMGQRTKWGNCSARRNLSFNWRLILAPDYVLRYLVTHEAVHLAVPDHSAKFWLTVQSLCRETEKAKQWLCRHQARMQVDLKDILRPAPERASDNSMQRTALRAAADAER